MGHVPLMEEYPEYWLGGGDTDGANDVDDDMHTNRERVHVLVGDTDSEAVFCPLLNALRCKYPEHMPSLPVLYQEIQQLCQEIVQYNPEETILDFLLACGPHVLWVYSWPGQRPGSTVWNGLHYTVRSSSSYTNLSDGDYSMDVLVGDSQDDRVCIVATKPLATDEEWVELKPGELILLDNGLPHVSAKDLFRVELLGHGLRNDGKALKPVRLVGMNSNQSSLLQVEYDELANNRPRSHSNKPSQR